MWQHCHHDYSHWDSGVNATLVYANSMFDVIRSNEDVYLAHITGNLEDIISAGKIYPSAGCLVGSIYCTPAFPLKNTNRLRLHNLGAYYFLKEIPKALSKPPANKLSPKILVIRATRRQGKGYAVEGVNYLRMGSIHYDIGFDTHTGLGSLLKSHERQQYQEIFLSAVKAEEDVLVKTIEQHTSKPASAEVDISYLNKVSSAVSRIPYLGYVLFEAFSTTLMLMQNDAHSIKCRGLGEFNNWNYKEIMYALYPDFCDNFRLSGFSPKWEDIIEIASKQGIFSDVSTDRFVTALATRTRKYICDNCFVNFSKFSDFQRENGLNRSIDWKYAVMHMKPLLGHLLHRELRNSTAERKEETFRHFEEDKAKRIWAYWNNKDILFPFNAVIAKGEIGINPCFDPIEFKYYRGNVCASNDSRDVIVEIGEPLKISMQSKLGELRHTLRRNTR